MTTESHTPLDAALDLFVFVPVGLAITAAEELPKLAAKGRSRVTTQLTMARVVGRFAVASGRSMIESRLTPATPQAPEAPQARHRTRPGGGPDLSYDEMLGREPNGSAPPPLRPVGNGSTAPGRAAAGEPGAAGEPAAPDGLPGAGRSESNTAISASVAGDLGSAHPAGERPDPSTLAIPGYDSLSASQVVQRLAGLSQQELAAVGAYEEAHRGRRTILNRVSQLQGR